MRTVLNQDGKTITTKSYGNYPYSSGVTVIVNTPQGTEKEDFETEINCRGTLPIDAYLVEKMLEIGFSVWVCRQGVDIMMTVIDPSLCEDDKWDEVYPLVLEGTEDLAWMLYDGDQFFAKLGISHGKDFLARHQHARDINNFFNPAPVATQPA